jgi:hypothetical protein
VNPLADIARMMSEAGENVRYIEVSPEEQGVRVMPVKSKAQSRFLNRKFGHAWVKRHHFGGSTKGLPKRVRKRSRK